jgi:hypothetical protein
MMRDVAGRIVLVLIGFFALVSPLSAAEEAWCVDGRRVGGALTLEQGRLHFHSKDGEELPLADLTRIRFAEKTAPPFRAGGGRRLRLRDGELITGQFLGLNKDTVSLRTAWAARVELPRSAVMSVDPLPGWRTVAEEDFGTESTIFKAIGEPARTEVRDGIGSRAVLLNEAGQALVYTLSPPLPVGRVGVNFQDNGPAGGARWTWELLFQNGERSHRLEVTVAGNGEHYAVHAEGLKGAMRQVAKSPGWHRLIVQFSNRSLRVTCDDDVLWYNLEEGPGGLLKQVTARCQKAPERGATVREGVAWTEFCLERAVNEHPQPPVDPEQDTLRLSSDDQLFGRILQADRHAIQIEARFGKRSLPWTDVAGCSFRRAGEPKRAQAGANIRILVRSGLCAEADVLEGAVTALDERRLTLRHALLGDLTFDRGRVLELRPLSGNLK